MLDDSQTESAPEGDRAAAPAPWRARASDAPHVEPAAERPSPPPQKPTERPAREAPAHGEQKPDAGKRPDGEGDKDKPDAPDGRKPRSRRGLMIAVAALVLIVGAPAGYLYWDNGSHFESTDDAFIAARQYSVAPKVAGYVTAVPVTDNQHVRQGEVIARIDERDYRVALEQATAQVAAADDNINNIDAQIAVQEAQVGHFRQAAEHDDLLLRATGRDHQDPRPDRGHHRRVAGQHAEITLDAGNVDLIDFAREGELFRGDEIEVEGGHQKIRLRLATKQSSS